MDDFDAAQHEPTPAAPSDNTTLVEVIDVYRASGFTGDLWAEDGAIVRCGQCLSTPDARRVPIRSVRRLAGASDPDDMVVVITMTCPLCDADGMMVLGFGPMSSDIDANVLVAMRDCRCDGRLAPDAGPGELPDPLPHPSG